MNENTELKTIGYTPFNYSADRALFRVNGGVPTKRHWNGRRIFCIWLTDSPKTRRLRRAPTATPGLRTFCWR